MAHSVEDEIRELRSFFRSERDPEGHVFAPLADAYRRAGDLDQAVELLTEGLAKHSDFVPGHVVSGWVRHDRGDVVDAALAFRAALALDTENTEALAGLAGLGEESGSDPAEGTAAPTEPGGAEPDTEIMASAVGGTGEETLERETPAIAEDKVPVTLTMADLYARQGLYGRALDVYLRLLERDPDSTALRERVSELESLSGKTAGAGSDAEEVETLARDWAEGPGETSELSTPFAWTPASTSGPERSAGPSAREYFQGLLSWESGGSTHAAPSLPVPDAESAAEAEPRVESEVSDAAETRAVPLAPGSAAVPISATTPPANTVAVPTFALDAVPIASTAPQVVDIAALAPHPDDTALRERVSELELLGGIPASASGPEHSVGASAREHAEGLLAWEFDEPTAEFAGPAAEAEPRVESEVPDAAETGAVSLAPGSTAETIPATTALPSTAPAHTAPVPTLASDAVPIASLAPDTADIATLAPDPSGVADGQVLDGRTPRR